MEEDELESAEEKVEVGERGRSGLAVFLVGVAVGAVLGAGVAMLSAPQRGKVVRRQLKRRFEEIGDEARHRAEEWKDEASRRLSLNRRDKARGRRRTRS